MMPTINRRAALQTLATALAAPAFALPARAEPAAPKWKTAIGLNGFQSGSRKWT